MAPYGTHPVSSLYDVHSKIGSKETTLDVKFIHMFKDILETAGNNYMIVFKLTERTSSNCDLTKKAS